MSADDRTPDTTTDAPGREHDPIQHYEIRVEGRISPRWSAWFDGLIVEPDAGDRTTAIRGPVVDQAALHGLLQKLRDVGIPLLSLTQLPAPTSHTQRADSSSQPEGEMT